MYLNILFGSAYENLEGAYNVGPNSDSCVNTEKLVSLFCDSWNGKIKIDEINKFFREDFLDDDINFSYEIKKDENKKKEANFLQLDNSLIKKIFFYKPMFNIEEAVYLTAIGYKYLNVDDKNKNNYIIDKSIEYSLSKIINI